MRFLFVAWVAVVPEIVDIIESRPEIDSIIVGTDEHLTAKKNATVINYVRWHEDLDRDEPDYTLVPIMSCCGDAGGALGLVELGPESRFRLSWGTGRNIYPQWPPSTLPGLAQGSIQHHIPQGSCPDERRG